MAKNKPPSSARFFIADDIRLESSQKPILMGFFPNDKFSVELHEEISPSPENPITLSVICILICLFDYVGKHDVKVLLKDPDGEIMLSSDPLGTIESGTDSTSVDVNIVLKLSPFVIKRFGEYHLLVEIKKKKYEYKFFIARKEFS